MTPYIRKSQSCGSDVDISIGRNPGQLGWYEWVSNRIATASTNDSVLDVGTGMAHGLDIFKKHKIFNSWGQDVDNRLKKLNKNILISNLDDFQSKSFDIITCFDVLEHVFDDVYFFSNLKRIAKKTIYITTPNFSRSNALNYFHCREYTIPQFTNIFLPSEVWAASPDGWVNHTGLLKKIMTDDRIIYKDLTSKGLTHNWPIPTSLSFSHSSVDGLEWAHICGIFQLEESPTNYV